MRLGFTETLSAALLLADEQARKFGQEFVGTEHLLLGILAGKTGDAYRALQAETNVDHLAVEIAEALPKESAPSHITGRLPLSPKAQRAINSAVSEAQAAGAGAVSTGFLVLALAGDSDSAIAELLTQGGADLDELRGLLSRPAAGGEK
jgi:ATP-dependent Clp protease ATP-binding subunit ClpC